jgi:hypothetical protein
MGETSCELFAGRKTIDLGKIVRFILLGAEDL